MLSTRQGIFSTIVGTVISLLNAIIQFLTIFFVLLKFGSQFNGFVRLVTSFSMIIMTADGALGVATVILLVKPIVQNDWITANEIYSTAKKNYRKGAIVGLILAVLSSLVYPLYAGITSDGSIFSVDSWQNIGIVIGGTEGAATSGSLVASYWVLLAVTLTFSVKNFVSAYFFAVYENILAAENKNSIRRIIILFTDIIVYSILFALLSIDKVSPFIPFLSMLIYSPLKGMMVYFYVKKKYVWLKYYRDFNNYRLTTTKNKISISTLGTNILVNSDILIASLVLGLNVSSTLSLYLVIAVNTRLIMTNFITSFREFFVTLVTKRGRLSWESYAKYELYTYLIAGFTFINMSVLSPYFVSALYGDLGAASLKTSTENLVMDTKVFEFMFFDPRFSMIYASTTALILMCEAQTTIIQAKGRYAEVSKFQNYLGFTYVVAAFAVTYLFKEFQIGGDYCLIWGLCLMYALKTLTLIIRYTYLWTYVWKYATYNSTFKYVLNNFLILMVPVILVGIVNVLFLNPNFGVEKYATGSGKLAPLVALFFGCIIVATLLMILSAYLFSAKMMNGIIQNLPIINSFLRKKAEASRQKRFKEYGINQDEIVDNSNQLATAMYAIEEEATSNFVKVENSEVQVKAKNSSVYVIKGKE